jgi:hypothetical protein
MSYYFGGRVHFFEERTQIMSYQATPADKSAANAKGQQDYAVKPCSPPHAGLAKDLGLNEAWKNEEDDCYIAGWENAKNQDRK